MKIVRSRKWWVLAAVALIATASSCYYIRIPATPQDLKSMDLCIARDVFGGSSTYFSYVVVACSTGELKETLSETEIYWPWHELFPPDYLSYIMTDDRVSGIKIKGNFEVEYRFDRETRCFVRVGGRERGLVGDCYVSSPYSIRREDIFD